MEDPLWEWAWLLVETEINLNPELPSLPDLLNHKAYDPALCAPCTIFSHKAECKPDEPVVAMDFTIVTANVRSLKEKDTGFHGKASLLAEQFAEAGFEIIGLQETRSKISTVLNTNGYTRMTSASEAGQGGVEIWYCRVLHSSSTCLRFAWTFALMPPLGTSFHRISRPDGLRW